jgi:hypothetical protein
VLPPATRWLSDCDPHLLLTGRTAAGCCRVR